MKLNRPVIIKEVESVFEKFLIKKPLSSDGSVSSTTFRE